MKTLPLLTAAVLAACAGGSGPGAAPDAASGADGSDGPTSLGSVKPPDAASGEADVLSCAPGEQACLDEQTWAVCDFDGASWGATGTCADTALCDPESGACRVVICEPGEAQCVGLATYRVCNELGVNWEPVLKSCGSGDVCHEGSCQLCVPDQAFCVDAATTAMCDDTGTGHVDPSPCPEGTACHEFSGACADPVCDPGSIECTSGLAYHYCLPSGTGWDSEHLSCPKDFLCSEGNCIYKPCLPSVLLLVDRSGSMEANWPEVRQSVADVVEGNPDALFGLMSFPFDGKCGVLYAPELPIATYDKGVFEAWFDLHAPIGATPLTEALKGVLTSADLIFGAYRGAVVVLSDGGETCLKDEVTEDLVAITDALLSEKAIQTYVVGYKFTGDPVQLHAIASHGGTEIGTYIPAGSEAELTDAFQAVVNDFKQCGSAGP